MNSNILPFGIKKVEEEVSFGTLFCCSCDCESEVEIEKGKIQEYFCPKCQSQKTYLSQFQFRNEEYWNCDCGSAVFAITREGFRCLHCSELCKF